MTEPTKDQAKAMLAEIREHAPDIEGLLKDLYREGLVEGARCLRYLAVDGKEYGTSTAEGNIQPYVPTRCFACGYPIDYESGRPHCCDESRETAKAQKKNGNRTRPYLVPEQNASRRKIG